MINPHIVRKTSSPVAAPPEAGMHWINTATGTEYFSVGTSSVADWIARVNNGTWLTDAGVPAGGLGADNDFYLDSSNGDYYKKIAGVWVLQGNLKGTGVIPGGTTNQQLVKASNTDYDFSWQTQPTIITDHGALTGLADDDHAQYHNDSRGDARYYTKTLLDGGQLDSRYYTETEANTLLAGKENTGVASSLIAAHESAINPHPVYETSAEAQAKVDAHASLTNNPHAVTKAQVGLGSVVNTDTTTTANITDSVNKRFVTDANLTTIGNQSGVNTGDQDLSAKENAGVAASLLSLHVSDLDPHTQYLKESDAATTYEPKNTNIQSHISSSANPHGVTKAQVGLGNVPNLDTSTTSNITDSIDKRFITDAEKTVLGNTSGTNTGDQDLSGFVPYTGAVSGVDLGANKYIGQAGTFNVIENSFADTVFDLDLRQAYDSTFVLSADFQERKLHRNDGVAAFSWSVGSLFLTDPSSGKSGFSFEGGTFPYIEHNPSSDTISTGNANRFTFNNPFVSMSIIEDNTTVPSINLTTRELYDAGGSFPSIDYANYGLMNLSVTNMGSILDWGAGAGGSVKIFAGSNRDLVANFSTGELFSLSTLQKTVDFSLMLLVDGTANTSIDWNFHLLQYVGSTSIDWQNKYLYSTLFAGIISQDYGSHLLNNGSGFTSIDYSGHTLHDASGAVVTLNYGSSQLFDSGSFQSAQWDSRLLSDPTGNTSVSWGTRQLRDSGGSVVLNWNSKELYTTLGSAMFGWGDGTGVRTPALQIGRSALDLAPTATLHLDAGTAIATRMRFTAGTTTGTTATDGLEVGITSAGVAEVRQRENAALELYSNNTLRAQWTGSGNLFLDGSIQARGGSGSAAVPFWSFTSSSDCGMFRSAGSTLGFSTTGTQRLLISSAGAWDFTGSTQLLTPLGTVSLPTHSFAGDTNTGMYSPAADQIGFAGGGVVRFQIFTAGVESAAQVRGAGGSAGTPTFVGANDTNTGMFFLGSDVLGISTNGTEALRIGATQNVGIGGTANANAILDVQSVTKAFMPPRMTTTQKNAIATPTAGMMVYDSTLNKLCIRTASAWETITSL